jgi:hypothetical protein
MDGRAAKAIVPSLEEFFFMNAGKIDAAHALTMRHSDAQPLQCRTTSRRLRGTEAES